MWPQLRSDVAACRINVTDILALSPRACRRGPFSGLSTMKKVTRPVAHLTWHDLLTVCRAAIIADCRISEEECSEVAAYHPSLREPCRNAERRRARHDCCQMDTGGGPLGDAALSPVAVACIHFLEILLFGACHELDEARDHWYIGVLWASPLRQR